MACFDIGCVRGLHSYWWDISKEILVLVIEKRMAELDDLLILVVSLVFLLDDDLYFSVSECLFGLSLEVLSILYFSWFSIIISLS